MKARGTAVIYISHRMEEIMRLSDDITVVRDGEYVTTTEKDKTSIDKLIALMVGREMTDIYPRARLLVHRQSSPNSGNQEPRRVG